MHRALVEQDRQVARPDPLELDERRRVRACMPHDSADLRGAQIINPLGGRSSGGLQRVVGVDKSTSTRFERLAELPRTKGKKTLHWSASRLRDARLVTVSQTQNGDESVLSFSGLKTVFDLDRTRWTLHRNVNNHNIVWIFSNGAKTLSTKYAQ